MGGGSSGRNRAFGYKAQSNVGRTKTAYRAWARNRARADQSADWSGLDRGRPADFKVIKGKTPQSRQLAAFSIPHTKIHVLNR